MKEIAARKPRFRRVGVRFRLTRRDLRILEAVERHRFLTSSQIIRLFPGSKRGIARRLQKLFHAGFLERPVTQLSLRYSHGLHEFVYSLGPESVKLQPGKRRSVRSASPMFLAHALATSDFLVRVIRACEARGLQYIHQGELFAGAQKGLAGSVQISLASQFHNSTVIPDASFAIEWTTGDGTLRRHIYFLELDRGTMPVARRTLYQSSILRKVLGYAALSQGNSLEADLGIRRFQVLFVTSSRRRRDGIILTCKETSARPNLFLAATGEDIGDDPVAADWQSTGGRRFLIHTGREEFML